MTERAPRLRDRLRATGAASKFAVGRRDGLAVGLATGAAYLLGYLWMTDHLALRSDADIGWTTVDAPLRRALERRGSLSFEPIGLLEFGYGTLLVSPIDAAIGLALAALVGLNLALAYLAIVQPKACGLGAGTGLAAAVPALLSGSVCCAPVVLLVLGIQASGTLLTVLPWLLPVGVGLLAASLVYVAGLVDVADAASDGSGAAGA